MPVDPILVPLLAGLPEFPDAIEDFDVFREQDLAGGAVLVEQLVEPAPEGVERRTTQIPVEDGAIDLHIFTPATAGPHPVHVYFHGGGWIAGSIKHPIIDIQMSERAAGANCVVVTAEYRKAPEHRFPVGLNDCYATLLWVAEHVGELSGGSDVITLGGGSAGANLAAAVALRARGEGGPTVALQLLEVPALDLTLSLPSHQRNATGYGLTHVDLVKILGYYLTSPDDARNPYASPLLAEDLEGLPPAHIMSSEYDPLCDDGQEYARHLNEAGVPATFSLQRGQLHVSSALTKVLPAARAWREEVLTVLREVHLQTGHPATARHEP